MNFKKPFLLCLVLSFSFFLAEGKSLTLIKEIGASNDEIIFRRPNGVVVTENKTIFAADSMAHFVAKFDKEGKLQKKIGQRGRGPGDFYLPSHLSRFENHLFLSDFGNSRIIEMDLNLKILKYHKIHDGSPVIGNLCVIEKGKYAYVSSPSYTPDRYRSIKIIDTNSGSQKMFFGQLPQDVSVSEKKVLGSMSLRMYYRPFFSVDRGSREFIISFGNPGNPIEFFIYDYNGKSLDSFSYTFDKNYKMPEFLVKGSSPPKSMKFTTVSVHKIFVYNNHYIVFVSTLKFLGNARKFREPLKYDRTLVCLIFDKSKKELKSRFPAPNDLEVFSLNKDGLLSGYGKDKDDNPVIRIYKLVF